LNYLIIIPARAGSKGIVGKNTNLLKGKPLISYTIELALKYTSSDNICITTDDQKVIDIANKLGIKVPFVRPQNLADDSASASDVIKHALAFYKNEGKTYDAVIYLQPTSPFRKLFHIKEAVKVFESGVYDMVPSVCESHHNPYFSLFEENENGFLQRSKSAPENVVRRQDLPKVYHYNGSIYIINAKELMQSELHNLPRIKKYVMDDVYALDIDNMKDWNYCEFLLEKELIDFD